MNFFIEGDWHHKNKIGFELMIEEGLKVDFDYNVDKEYDCIINLSDFKSYSGHKGKIIYGPQIELQKILEKVNKISENAYVNLLSDWLVNLAASIEKSDKYLKLPFPVDVKKFCPGIKNGRPLIYKKNVDETIYNTIKNQLDFEYSLFDYAKRYNEDEFIECIKSAPFAIWIGRHESQGFAFQETLSCNTPIIVIDVKSLRDEIWNGHRPWQNFRPDKDLKATAASYFDETCGVISDTNNFSVDFNIFRENLKNYEPRAFIKKKLSPVACFEYWIKTLSSL